MAEWVGFLLVALGFRALVGFSYRRAAEDAPDLVVRTWLRPFRATFAIQGAVWGLAA